MSTKNKYTLTDQLITRITGYIAGALLFVLALWGLQTLWKLYLYEETNDAQVQEYINPLISRAGGFITEVKFEENQQVKEGDTLLLIDNREYLIQQAQTEAALQNAQAQLEVLESKLHTQDEITQVSNSEIVATKVKAWEQKLEYDRYRQLFEVESATKQQLEKVEAKLGVAEADLQAARERYQVSLAKTQDLKAQEIVEKAEIMRLKALLDRHKLDVSYTVITAPYDCRIGRRTIEKGQMIDAGQVLAHIVNNETDKWVVANYKETQIRHMQVGQLAEIAADAFPDEKFKGQIISLSPATGSSFSLLPPDNSTGNYVKIVQRIPVRIKVLGSRDEIARLKVGMNVNVTITKAKS